MTSQTVDVIVVAYGGVQDLAWSLESALASIDVDPRITVVDNGPSEEGVRQLAERFGIDYRPMPGNVGFCRAVNEGLRRTRNPFVALLNPDARISPAYLSILMETIESDSRIASAGGRILRDVPSPASLIDSTGIMMQPGRRPIDVGHGEPDDGRRKGRTEVFGVTAAAAVYRRSALDRVTVQGEALPEDFFMYLDDVDLAWRLRLAGFTSIVNHRAIAWHTRGQAGDRSETTSEIGRWFSKAGHEAKRPDYVRVLSATNLLLTILRNDDPDSFLRQWPRFVARRLPADGWMALQRPSAALESRLRFAKRIPNALVARREIQSSRAVTAKELARWLP